MIVIFLLIPLSIVIASCFLAAFVWAVRTGQFEDTDTPSWRMLWEDRGRRNLGKGPETGANGQSSTGGKE